MLGYRLFLASSVIAASLLGSACAGNDKELTPEEAAAKLAKDLNTANTLVRNNKLAEAQKILEPVLKDNPNNADALAALGKVRFEQKKYDEAEAMLTAAIAQKPDDPAAYFTLGQTRQMADNFDGAAQAYGQAFTLDAQDSDYGLSYGRMLKKTGQYDKAETVLRSVSELDPKSQFVFTELGDVLREQKKLDDSLRTYMKAQNTYPSDKQAYAGAALVYEAQGDNRHALDEWSTYIRMDCCSEYSKTVAQKKIDSLSVDFGDDSNEPD